MRYPRLDMAPHAVRLHRWDEIALDKVTEMLSRKIVAGEREMLVQVYVKRGCLVPMHAHESEQMVYVLQGALKFLIGGDEITVREGEVLHIPSGVEHQAEALEVEEEAVAEALEGLEKELEGSARGVRLRKVAGGFALAAVPEAEDAARRLLANPRASRFRQTGSTP